MVSLSVLYRFCDCEFKCVCRARLLLHVKRVSIVRAFETNLVNTRKGEMEFGMVRAWSLTY
jgi:hypothetical protein